MHRAAFASLTLVTACATAPRPDLLVADFETGDYGTWTARGAAMGTGPAQGTLPGQMAVSGFAGHGLVDTFAGGDGSTGTLESPPFRIERSWLHFLIGGGKDPERLALQLLVDGAVVRAATGGNDRPGGSEALAPAAWDVAEFVGRTAVLRVLDTATGGWGHLNVDQIVQSDRRPPQLRRDVERTFAVDRQYLLLPIRNGAPKRRVTLLVDGHVEVDNAIELADAAPDWQAVIDVGAWRGRAVTLRVDQLMDDSRALAQMRLADAIPGAEPLYGEPLRAQLHFSPRRGWTNDPNGLVWFAGEYHLFFQHNPYGWSWGNMHWGHAVSPDLVHWRELGEALAPDRLGTIYSGSAVVDATNSSGLGTRDRPPLVLVYTAAGEPFVQCLAASTDGRTFTKFGANPVLGNVTAENRDPRVFWHAPTRRWVMALYVARERRHTVHLFTSPDLRTWTFASEVAGDVGGGYLFECPDLFALPLDGDPQQTKWVLTAADGQYAVGAFDGTRFTPERAHLRGIDGRGWYAAQTFAGGPPGDARRVQIGWLQTETRGMPFNQAMSLPFELSLRSTPDGPRLRRTPVRELEALRQRTLWQGALDLADGGAAPFDGLTAELVELRADFAPDAAARVAFTVRGIAIVYDAAHQELAVGDLRVPAPLQDGRQRLVVYCDRTALEVLASDGLVYVPLPCTPAADDRGLALRVRGGGASFAALAAYSLASIWPK